MGCGAVKITPVSKEIDDSIKHERKKPPIKLLLLGTGDSGKSTFARQMKVIYHTGFSSAEFLRFSPILKNNTLQSIQILITQARQRDFKFPKKFERCADRILTAPELVPSIGLDIQKIWSCSAIQQTWHIRNEFQIPTMAEYYISNVIRIAKEDYMSTTDDIIHAKLKTTGIVETLFEVKNRQFLMVDVGGQRTERRKWLHSFEGVSAIIYIAAIDEYDMTLSEDHRTNRMLESLRLFSEVSGSPYFRKTTWILFLNKYDVFLQKFETTHQSLQKLFPEYTAGPNFSEGLQFIKKKYQQSFMGVGRLDVFVTCAIDTQNVDKIFTSVQESILVQNLTSSYFT